MFKVRSTFVVFGLSVMAFSAYGGVLCGISYGVSSQSDRPGEHVTMKVTANSQDDSKVGTIVTVEVLSPQDKEKAIAVTLIPDANLCFSWENGSMRKTLLIKDGQILEESKFLDKAIQEAIEKSQREDDLLDAKRRAAPKN